MAIRNIEEINSAAMNKANREEMEKRERAEQVNNMFASIFKHKDDLVDMVDTAGYLKSKGFNPSFDGFSVNGECIYFTYYTHNAFNDRYTIYIYPKENSISACGSICHGTMGETYYVSANNTNDYTNRRMLDSNYQMAFQTCLGRLTKSIEQFFGYVELIKTK